MAGRKIGDGLIVSVRMLKGEAMGKHEVSFENQLIGGVTWVSNNDCKTSPFVPCDPQHAFPLCSTF